ncbi:hypothetical protein AB0759_11010 [Scytonema tolypothrichoides VB-61278_2]|uniref:Uncharacterized protein n=1 Tax=Scytonema tolypothrichoides VB-61278_2 TaxID=3232314 RepID=A0ABW8WJM4_9CYAN
MATVDEYRQYIQHLLTEHAKPIWDNRIQAQTIFDTGIRSSKDAPLYGVC